jgi:predicted membrane-bound spermidine synthase
MLVEVSQLQRLNIFLGHPTYGLSVVLFALLLCSGLGSWATKYINSTPWRLSSAGVLLGLLAVLLCFGLVTPSVLQFFKASVTPVRIAVAIAILAPIGLLMGTAFPLGMQWASKRNGALTPWLWGINGASSVCARCWR